MESTRSSLAVAGILLAGLVLTGCVTVNSPPKPGLTQAERQEQLQRTADELWKSTGLPEGQRPAIDNLAPVGLDNVYDAFVTCMNRNGYHEYQTTPDGGYTIDNGDASTEETITVFRCQVTYQVDPNAYVLNSAQLAYLYDYYQDALVPCLVRAGYPDVALASPTRREMIENGGWNPYVGVPNDIFSQLTSTSPLVRMCPPVPEEMGLDLQWFPEG